jgi:hypothetical protein
MPLFLIVLAVVLSVGALLLFSIWGLPVVLLTILVIGGYLLIARRGDSSVGTIERAKHEPTGVPRKARGDADTANERVGQG